MGVSETAVMVGVDAWVTEFSWCGKVTLKDNNRVYGSGVQKRVGK